ncbi:hybrid sensor histidine kinase/response regulator transcription factor [Spirosoma gilvum]
MIGRRIVLTILLWKYVPLVFAQVGPSGDRTLTTANGLPNSTITGLVQDRTGFIWIATADGLARYDGRSVKVFRHEDQPNSLGENNIINLQNLSDGTLLLQTRTGDFQRFNPVTERFFQFLPLKQQGERRIEDGYLTSDRKGFWALWRGGKVQHYDLQQHRIRFWDKRILGANTRHMDTMMPASNGSVYVHYYKGIIEINPKTGTHREIPFTGPITHWMSREMLAPDGIIMAERGNGDIIIMGKHHLLLLNPKTSQYQDIVMPGSLNPNSAYGLRVLADGNVYVGIGKQLYQFTNNNRFDLIHERQKGTRETVTYSIPYLLDHSGVFWMLTEAGIVQFNQHQLPFQTYTYKVDWKTDLLQIVLGVKPPSWKMSSGDSWTRFTYANNHFWFIDVASLYRCNPASHRLEWSSSDLTGDRCACKITLKPDQRDRLWVYANEKGGLTEMDSNGRIKQFWPNSLVPLTFVNPGLDLSDIQPMGSVVWMASNQGKGLYKYDLRQKKIVTQLLHSPSNSQSLPTNQLLCLLADPKQPTTVLWIGTVDAGLTRFDTKTGHVKTFTEKDGLPNNTINSLQADRQGFIWMGTNKGLVRLDPHSFHKRVFTREDGLQDNEFNFAVSAQLPDGRLAFGSPTGMTIFNPAAIKEDTFEPPVVLSALRVNNTIVEPNQTDSPLSAPINALTQLSLDYTQNFLTVEFAGLEYSKHDKIQYRYRLIGVDNDWVDAGTQHTANYTQLRPGNYTFEVMATNTDGRWNSHPKQLAVVITPPFWATWWAYALYTLILGGAIFSFVQFRVRQGRQQQEMELRRRESEQLKAVDELKTRFFSNITHEFRTPLSLILSPTEKLLQETKHDTLTRQTLTSVQRNAGQLLRLINQLLDLSKLEAGGMTISLARGNVVPFIEQLVESFRPAAEQKGVALLVRTDTMPEDHVFDADKWTTIITNLLANALKFTPAGGQVSIELIPIGQEAIRLIISDTGIGISAEKLPHIFDRFYQVDDTRTRAYEGTGIGLALVNELIDILDGTIAVESQPNKGTTFTVQLPVLPALVDADIPMVVLPAPIKQELTYLHNHAEVTQPSSQVDQPLIVVVEDNTELRNFIASELAASYRILTAKNGHEGWQLAQTELPNVVISDIMMPGMDGYELTRLLKTNSITNHIAVMLLTARASHESRMEGLMQGADDYLIKPFHLDELHQRIRNLLTRQQSLREYYYQQFTQPDDAFNPDVVEDKFLQQLHTAIDTHLADSTFGVDELARQVGMSRRTLHRKLATVANQSANDIIRQYRLKRAAQLLLAGHNVSETAYLVGYESPAHFSLIFKEFFQKTPTEYTQR